MSKIVAATALDFWLDAFLPCTDMPSALVDPRSDDTAGEVTVQLKLMCVQLHGTDRHCSSRGFCGHEHIEGGGVASCYNQCGTCANDE